jgi:hypothetical protein
MHALNYARTQMGGRHDFVMAELKKAVQADSSNKEAWYELAKYLHSRYVTAKNARKMSAVSTYDRELLLLAVDKMRGYPFTEADKEFRAGLIRNYDDIKDSVFPRDAAYHSRPNDSEMGSYLAFAKAKMEVDLALSNCGPMNASVTGESEEEKKLKRCYDRADAAMKKARAAAQPAYDALKRVQNGSLDGVRAQQQEIENYGKNVECRGTGQPQSECGKVWSDPNAPKTGKDGCPT